MTTKTYNYGINDLSISDSMKAKIIKGDMIWL